MEKILIGKITGVTGLKGEVRVYNYSDSISIYESTEKIFAGEDLMTAEKIRTQKNMVVLKFKEIENRDQAEKLRGRELFVTEDDLPELPEGQYYIRDIIGMQVQNPAGEIIGIVEDLIQNTAQDILDVKTPEGRQVLIPRVPEFVKDTDIENKIITVEPIEGMI